MLKISCQFKFYAALLNTTDCKDWSGEGKEMSVLALPAYVLGFYLHSSASVVLSRHSVDSLEEKKK